MQVSCQNFYLKSDGDLFFLYSHRSSSRTCRSYETTEYAPPTKAKKRFDRGFLFHSDYQRIMTF